MYPRIYQKSSCATAQVLCYPGGMQLLERVQLRRPGDISNGEDVQSEQVSLGISEKTTLGKLEVEKESC